MTLGFGEEWPPGVCPGEIHGGPSDLIRRPGAAQAAAGPTGGAGPDGLREREWGSHAEVQRTCMGGGPISLIRAARAC